MFLIVYAVAIAIGSYLLIEDFVVWYRKRKRKR